MVSEDVSSPSVSLLDFSAATLMGIQIHNSLLAYATSELFFLVFESGVSDVR